MLVEPDPVKPAPIDYGPALDAIDDLFEWAFALLAQEVDDAPVDRRRVRNVRTFLRKRLDGKSPRPPLDDLWFVASLLARVLEADLGMPLGDIVRALDEIGLPTDDVPRVVTTTPPCRLRVDRAVIAEALAAFDEQAPSYFEDEAIELDLIARLRERADRRTARDAPLPCAGCLHHYRNAA